MEAPRFNIPSALAMLYGIAQPIAFPGVVAGAEQQYPEISFGGVQMVPDGTVVPTSHIGTPIFLPITFRGGPYKRYDRQGRVEEAKGIGDLRLPITSVAEMSATKTITTTQVSANDSSVKEVFGFGDWDIRISGILFDETKHPDGATTTETMEERLLAFYGLADSIEVDATLFNRRGINRLVIRSINFQQMPGRPRMMGYQMQCDSDAAIELLIQ
jgi:hypothetical protein